MPTWLVVLIALTVLVLLFVIVVELPGKNRLVEIAGKEDPTKLIQRLDAGADPSAEGWFGLTPLMGAILEGRRENVKILLERGAKPNRAKGKMSHLSQCMEHQRWDIMEDLLQAGADPNLPGFLNRSAFEEACESGHLEAAILMLKHGADVRSVDRAGEEILFGVVAMAVAENKKAKREEYVQIIHALIEHGANPNSRSKDGIPLVVPAISQPMVLRALVDAGAITDVAWDGAEFKAAIEEALANDPDAPTNPSTPTS